MDTKPQLYVSLSSHRKHIAYFTYWTNNKKSPCIAYFIDLLSAFKPEPSGHVRKLYEDDP